MLNRSRTQLSPHHRSSMDSIANNFITMLAFVEKAGYLTVRKVSGAGEAYARFNVGQLTWKGHEAIEQMRK